MAACRNCMTILSDSELLANDGVCPGPCGRRVCNLCGCTEANPCTRTATDGTYACAWPGPPPLPCSFCYQATAERLYAEATQ
jgi:hypothetical protein